MAKRREDTPDQKDCLNLQTSLPPHSSLRIVLVWVSDLEKKKRNKSINYYLNVQSTADKGWQLEPVVKENWL